MNVKASILVTIGRRPLPRKRSPGFGSDRTSDEKGTARPPDTDISRLITLQICAAGRVHGRNISIRISIRKISMALDYWGHGWPRSRSPLTGTSIFLSFPFFFSSFLEPNFLPNYVYFSLREEKNIKISIFIFQGEIKQDLDLVSRRFFVSAGKGTDSSLARRSESLFAHRSSDVIGISIRTFRRGFIFNRSELREMRKMAVKRSQNGSCVYESVPVTRAIPACTRSLPLLA